MAAIEAGQLSDADLSPERRANLAASKAALTQTLMNLDGLRKQTEDLERVLTEKQTTREQILKSNDRDIANGVRAPDRLLVIASLEAAGRMGKLFDLPLDEVATPFNLAEQSKSGSEFVAKAGDQADSMMAEVESRALGLIGAPGSGADAVEGASGSATTRPADGGRIREGWANIGKPTGDSNRPGDRDVAGNVAKASDVGALGSGGEAGKETAAGREQPELDRRDPLLGQILQLQTSVLQARRLGLVARRAASLGVVPADTAIDRGPSQ